MNTSNPFAPPNAAVADIGEPWNGEFQPMKIWSWRGRIGRLRLLAYGSVAYFIYVVLTIALSMLAGAAMSGVADAGGSVFATGAGLVVWMLLVPYLVFMATVGIRRSHDMGWSGWMSLLAFIPLVGLIWIFKAGNPAANDYGAPPPPNTIGVKLAAFGLCVVVFVGGILAAIAIPAYQGYVERARAAQPAK